MLHDFVPTDADLFLEEQSFLDDHDLLDDWNDNRIAFLPDCRRSVDDTIDRQALDDGLARMEVELGVFGPFQYGSPDKDSIGFAYGFIDAQPFLDYRKGGDARFISSQTAPATSSIARRTRGMEGLFLCQNGKSRLPENRTALCVFAHGNPTNTMEFGMGLLDQVLGQILASQQTGAETSSSGIGSVLMNMLSGESTGTAATGGGLGGLLSSFEQAGLGHIAQSWIGNGPNQPVSAQQLQTVLGNDQVQTMASQAGMAPHDFLSQLSQHLPRVVDGMTPNGQIPEEGTISV